MAVTLLRVLVLGVIAAAADDVPITWWSSPRASLSCVVPDAERIVTRRPPPPLNTDEKPRPRQPYLWRKGNEDLKRVLSNGALEVLRKKDGSSEGVYQCAVRHSAGLVLGYPLRLKFAYLDKQFSVHPENTTAWVGQSYVLSCDINSGPAATVAWQKDGEPLRNNDRYYVLKNQLLILDLQKEDAGLYRCKATNSFANRTRVSHGGRLQVEYYSGFGDMEPALLPLQQDGNITVTKREPVVLACPVTGFPKPTLIWQFTPPGERTAELEHIGEVLTLQRLDIYEEGVYSCQVEGYSNLVKVFNVSISTPVNITAPPISKHAFQASTVRFNCTAVGNPAPNVTWYKNGKPLVLAGRIAMRQSADKPMELLIRSVTSEDAGIYQCFASNGHSIASSWAVLNVTGSAVTSPTGVKCLPIAAQRVLVSWPKINNTIAYTVEFSRPGGSSLPIQPSLQTEETLNLEEELTPYIFQIRAYIQIMPSNKTVASDMSEGVTCQGQGVPIRFSRSNDSVYVSWRQFAWQKEGIKQWILQYKADGELQEHNITLGPKVTNYTITTNSPSQLQVRLLGTKQLPWLQQNLTLVPWRSTANAAHVPDPGEDTGKISKVEIKDLSPRKFVVHWSYEVTEMSDTYVYTVCTKIVDDDKEECFETTFTWAAVENLTPSTEYSVRVKAHDTTRPYLSTEFTQPIQVTTPPDGPERIKDLTYSVINQTSLRVSWNSTPDRYTVYYKDILVLPIVDWPSIDTRENSVLITNVNTSKELYVIVAGYDPVVYSSVLHIPIHEPISEVKELNYTFTSVGLRVTWQKPEPRLVRYTQNLSQSLDQWTSLNVTAQYVDITRIDPSLPTHVVVTVPGQSASQVLTVPSRPSDNALLYLSVGIGCTVFLVCLLAAAAFCIWHRRKRARPAGRSRRRSVSASDGQEEEMAEIRNVGSQLANGGSSKDAGEPLLNGHVHITENPNPSKTPNGRMRRRYEPTFDMSRYDDTLETVLNDTSTTFNLLDTSRPPEYDLSRSSHQLSQNNSFNKLPDDNMNSELTRSTDFQLDNSQILPTLQPNG